MLHRLVSAVRNRLPFYNRNRSLTNELRQWKKGLYFPGHYYSPIVAIDSLPREIKLNYASSIPGVELRENEQLALISLLKDFYDGELFPVEKQGSHRYYFNNDYFSYSDGIFLNLILRHFKPKRIIEIGSGFSSALMLDTNERYLENQTELTFIEPYPEERLNGLLGHQANCTVLKQFVQDIPLKVFRRLSTGDVLFVDSSHISKFGSDLNYILFEVLPVLESGVIIHFHDIFFPFEYPLQWLQQGRSWNEAYILRSFLQYNSAFDILLFTSFLEGKYRNWFLQHMPMCLNRHEKIQVGSDIELMDTTGQSIYLVKK